MKSIITAVVIAAAAFTATKASAYEAKDCPFIAEAAKVIAKGRDGGLSLTTSKIIVVEEQYPFDVERLLLRIVEVAFEKPEITPAILGAVTLQLCVNKFSTDT